ncbi:hypothetical protein RGUI_3981 [Rhodovulum sp. P5]|nr:hypothetical protein RGUI_3981 [Rhodovulum sp. P5]
MRHRTNASGPCASPIVPARGSVFPDHGRLNDDLPVPGKPRPGLAR